MNKTLIMLSVSTFALLAASQIALAKEPLKASTSTIGHSLLLDKRVLILQKPNSPVANGTTNGVKTGTNGGLTGIGVPGGLNTGTGFKTPSGSSVMPKGAADIIKDGVSGIKLGAGQAKGVEAKGTISDRLAPGMIKAIKDDFATRGKELGVQQGDGISAKLAPGMIKAIKDDNASKGKEKGVQSGDSGYRLTPGQLQQIKDMTINPKINPVLGAINFKDEKGDGKGGTGKAPAPKPSGDAKPAPKPNPGGGTGTAGTKPAPKPNPGGGTGTAGTKPAPKKDGKGGGTVVVVNPKTGTGTSKTPGAKVLNGGKLVIFDPVKITPKPAKGPLDPKIFEGKKPPKPPKLEVIGSPAMDRLQ